MQKIPPSSFALIIGAMKSGTSFLYRHAQQHPRICPCRVKEPEFFSSNQGHGADVERYEELWDYDSSRHTYCLEASTGYTKYPNEKNVPANIFHHGLRPRFIYIVRHPIDRLVSQYNFARFHLEYELEDDLLQDRFLNWSRYFLQLSQYLEFFPDKRNYLILDFENVKQAPDELMGEVFDFLELENYEKGGETRDDPVLKTLNRTKLEQTFYDLGITPFIRKFIPKRVKEIAKKSAGRVSDSTWCRPSTEEEAVLRERLYNDMKRFEEEFGFDVGKWGF